MRAPGAGQHRPEKPRHQVLRLGQLCLPSTLALTMRCGESGAEPMNTADQVVLEHPLDRADRPRGRRVEVSAVWIAFTLDHLAALRVLLVLPHHPPESKRAVADRANGILLVVVLVEHVDSFIQALISPRTF